LEWQSAMQEAKDVLASLMASELYQRVLGLAKTFEDNFQIALGSLDGWTHGVDVPIDYDAYGFPNWKDAVGETGNVMTVYYKVEGKSIHVKVLGAAPLQADHGKVKACTGYVGMWTELDLWPLWNPVASMPATPLQTPSRDFMEYESADRVNAMIKLSSITELQQFFWEEEGVHMMHWHTLDASDERTNKTPPSGYKRDMSGGTIQSIWISQEKHTAIVYHAVKHLPFAPPHWVIQLYVFYVLPSFIRNMFAASFTTCRKEPYSQRFQDDRHGLYSAVDRIYEAGIRCARRRQELGFSPFAGKGNLPSPDFAHRRKNSLPSLHARLSDLLAGSGKNQA